MNRLSVTLAALSSLIATPILAADLAVKAPPPAPPPVYSWTGFYLGANAGVTWASNSSYLFADPLGAGPFAPAPLSLSSSGAMMGGVQVGYNYQFAPGWVAGIEADWSWTGLHLSARGPLFSAAGVLLNNSNFAAIDVPGIGTVRGRLGYSGIPNWLIYATGGWAYADFRDTGSTSNATSTFFNVGNLDKVSSGWTVGGGFEYHLPVAGPGSWIVGLEYLYYAFSSEQTLAVAHPTPGGFPSCAVGCFPETFGSFNVQEVRARLSYKF
jgi:outer membrane immunogenic protein